MSDIYQVVIIGGGCSGLTAAIYTGRANLNPLVFAGSYQDKGGLLTKTSIVENFPSYPNGIEGYDLIVNMEEQAVNFGATIINEEVTEVDFEKRPFKVVTTNNIKYYTNSIIIATGSTPNKLNLPNEDKFWSLGISSCAVCEGSLYRNKKIVVIGGGDSAVEEALFLTKFSDVTIIHRRDVFRASKIMQQKLCKNKKIKIIYNSIVTELIGNDKLENIVIKNVLSGKTQTLEVDGMFYGLGLLPNTKLFQNKLDMDEDGYIKKICSENTLTSVKGVFVCGDASDKHYRQAIVACGEGCKAAIDVDSYLSSLT